MFINEKEHEEEEEEEEKEEKNVLYLISESGNAVVNKRSSIPCCGKRRGPDASHRLSYFLSLLEARFTAAFMFSVTLRLIYVHLHGSKRSEILLRF
jgi:hypothetical protein